MKNNKKNTTIKEDDSVNNNNELNKFSEKSEADIADANEGSIAETLWDDYQKDEVTTDIDSLMMKRNENVQKNKEENSNNLIKEERSNEYGEEKENEDKKRMEDPLPKKKKNKIKFFLVFGIMPMIIFGVAFMVGRLSVENKEKIIVKECEVPAEPVIQQEKEEPVAIIEEKIKEADFSKTNILVLNGGTKVGVAGKMKDLIVSTDSLIENIEAKNAIGEYADETVIYYQDGFEVEAKKVGEILEKKYGQLEIKRTKEFPENEIKENIVIIIGEK